MTRQDHHNHHSGGKERIIQKDHRQTKSRSPMITKTSETMTTMTSFIYHIIGSTISQFGIGSSQGGLALTMFIRGKPQEIPDHVVASLGFKNAFCSTQRDHCLTVLHRLCPHRPAWLDVALTLLARPMVINNPTAVKPSATWDGLPYGGSTQHPALLRRYDRDGALKQLTSEVQASRSR